MCFGWLLFHYIAIGFMALASESSYIIVDRLYWFCYNVGMESLCVSDNCWLILLFCDVFVTHHQSCFDRDSLINVV